MPRLCLFLKEEKKMDEKSEGIVKARYRALAPAVKAALERRGYEAYVCEDAAQAAEQVLSLITCSDNIVPSPRRSVMVCTLEETLPRTDAGESISTVSGN